MENVMENGGSDRLQSMVQGTLGFVLLVSKATGFHQHPASALEHDGAGAGGAVVSVLGQGLYKRGRAGYEGRGEQIM